MKKKIFLLLLSVLLFYAFKNYAKKVKHEEGFITAVASEIFDFNTLHLKVDTTLNVMDFKVKNKNSGKIIFENGTYKE